MIIIRIRVINDDDVIVAAAMALHDLYLLFLTDIEHPHITQVF